MFNGVKQFGVSRLAL